jgi:hypothetical protein
MVGMLAVAAVLAAAVGLRAPALATGGAPQARSQQPPAAAAQPAENSTL